MGDFDKATLEADTEYKKREYDQSVCFQYSPRDNSTQLFNEWQACLNKNTNTGSVERTALDCELENTVKCGSIESLFACYNKNLVKPGQAKDSFEPRTLNRSLCFRAYPYAHETSEYSKMRNYSQDLENKTSLNILEARYDCMERFLGIPRDREFCENSTSNADDKFSCLERYGIELKIDDYVFKYNSLEDWQHYGTNSALESALKRHGIKPDSSRCVYDLRKNRQTNS